MYFSALDGEIDVLPAIKRKGRVVATYRASPVCVSRARMLITT